MERGQRRGTRKTLFTGTRSLILIAGISWQDALYGRGFSVIMHAAQHSGSVGGQALRRARP